MRSLDIQFFENRVIWQEALGPQEASAPAVETVTSNPAEAAVQARQEGLATDVSSDLQKPLGTPPPEPSAGPESQEAPKPETPESKKAADTKAAKDALDKADPNGTIAPQIKDAFSQVATVYDAVTGDNKSQVLREMTSVLKENLKEHPDSRLLGAAYQICSIFGQYFDMAISNEELSSAIENTHTEEFSKANLDKVYKKTTIYKLIDNYETAKKDDTEKSDATTQKALLEAKKELIDYAEANDVELTEDNFDTDLENLKNGMNDLAKETLSDAEKQALGDDSAISTYYVYRQLYFLSKEDRAKSAYVGTTNDPEILYSELLRTKPKTGNADIGYKQVLAPAKQDKTPIENPPVGTVLFFGVTMPNGQQGLLTGIAIEGGKVNIQIKSELKTLDFKDIDKDLSEYEKQGNEKGSRDMLGGLAKIIGTITRTAGDGGDTHFRGAFVPAETSVWKHTEPVKPKETQAAEGAAATPAETPATPAGTPAKAPTKKK